MKAKYHKDGLVWVFNCGWQVEGQHPYRHELDGIGFISNPIGIQAFHKEFGVYPTEDYDTPWSTYHSMVLDENESLPTGMKIHIGERITMIASF